MVQKKCKYGFNTGNTLRSFNRLHFKKPGTITRSAISPSLRQTQIESLQKLSDDESTEGENTFADECTGNVDEDAWNSNIEEVMDNCMGEKSNLQSQIYGEELHTLKHYEDYIPQLGIAYSLNKNYRWELKDILRYQVIELTKAASSNKIIATADVKFVEIRSTLVEIGGNPYNNFFCNDSDTNSTKFLQELKEVSPLEARLYALYHQPKHVIYHNSKHRGTQRSAHCEINKGRPPSNSLTNTEYKDAQMLRRRYRRRGIKLKNVNSEIQKKKARSPVDPYISSMESFKQDVQHSTFNRNLSQKITATYEVHCGSFESRDMAKCPNVQSVQCGLKKSEKRNLWQHHISNECRYMLQEKKKRKPRKRLPPMYSTPIGLPPGALKKRSEKIRSIQPVVQCIPSDPQENVLFMTSMPFADDFTASDSEKSEGDDMNIVDVKQTEVTLWHFVDALLSTRKTSQTIKLKKCKGKCSKRTMCMKPDDNSHRAGKQCEKCRRPISGLLTTCSCGDKGYVRNKANQIERNEKSTNFKDKVSVINNVSLDDAQTTTNNAKQDVAMFQLPPLIAKLKPVSIQHNNLYKKYSSNYLECSSYPRRFLIDVSNYVPGDNRVKITPLEDPIAVILFALCDENVEMKTTQPYQMAWIYVKFDLSSDDQILIHEKFKHAIKGHFVFPVSKIISYFTDCLRCITDTSLLERPSITSTSCCPAVTSLGRTRMDWLYALCDWQYDIHTRSEAYVRGAAHENQMLNLQRPSTSESMQRKSFFPSSTKQCEIMCAHFGDSMAAETCNQPMMTLQPCHHTFCYSCFQKYLAEKLKQGLISFLCPRKDCATILGQVAMLWGMSLAQYHQLEHRKKEVLVARHPQWEWCPQENCNRAVRLKGTGLLDKGVVIQCECGSVWCFQCRREAHWPANCSHAANYKCLLQNEEKDISVNTIKKRLCNGCSSDSSGKLMLTEQCCCQYEFCIQCLNVANSSIAIPEAVLNLEEMEWEGSRHLLLPALFYRCALTHRIQHQHWDEKKAEQRAASLAKLIQKSRKPSSKSACSGPVLTSPSVPIRGRRRNAGVRLIPSSTSEQLFFYIVEKFIFQVHWMLEWVYVHVMHCAKNESSSLMTHVLRLESITFQIEQLLNNLAFTPSSLTSRAKRLLDIGQKHVNVIANISGGLHVASSLQQTNNNHVGLSRKQIPRIPHRPPGAPPEAFCSNGVPG